MTTQVSTFNQQNNLLKALAGTPPTEGVLLKLPNDSTARHADNAYHRFAAELPDEAELTKSDPTHWPATWLDKSEFNGSWFYPAKIKWIIFAKFHTSFDWLSAEEARSYAMAKQSAGLQPCVEPIFVEHVREWSTQPDAFTQEVKGVHDALLSLFSTSFIHHWPETDVLVGEIEMTLTTAKSRLFASRTYEYPQYLSA